MHSMNRVWRQSRLQLHTKLRLYQTCILSILLYTVRKHGHFCRKTYGSLRLSTCAASVWFSGYAGMTSSEIQKSLTLPTCPVSRTSSPGGETHCWPCGKTRPPHASPSCVVTGRGNPNYGWTRGFNKSPTAHLLSFAPSGPGLAVVDTSGLGWRNGPLPSLRSDDDDDDDDDDEYGLSRELLTFDELLYATALLRKMKPNTVLMNSSI